MRATTGPTGGDSAEAGAGDRTAQKMIRQPSPKRMRKPNRAKLMKLYSAAEGSRSSGTQSSWDRDCGAGRSWMLLMEGLLVVMSREVVDPAGGWGTDRGVDPVVIIEVQ